MLCLFCSYFLCLLNFLFFFFNDTATTEIYTLSLHDALPIRREELVVAKALAVFLPSVTVAYAVYFAYALDRKSTRLNSSHTVISYAVFCLKKKIQLLSNHAKL